MIEIEKMFENAGIKKLLYCNICKAQEHSLGLCAETQCDTFYPPFTAEKQLELIKWLGKRPLALLVGQHKDKYYFGNSNFNSKADSFDNAIAIRINDLWQDLTDQEKEEIRRILRSQYATMHGT